jgi:hypothetical protein
MDENLQDLRGRVLRNEKVEPEEYAALVDSLRVARKAAKTKKEPDLGNLPSDLNDLFAKVEPEKKPS